MRENEFEKQLKHLMEDFNLSPSAKVWDKLSEKLNTKRRRKTPFIFFMVMGLAAAGYLMFHINASDEKSLPQQVSEHRNETAKNNSHQNKTATIAVQNDKAETNVIVPKKNMDDRGRLLNRDIALNPSVKKYPSKNNDKGNVATGEEKVADSTKSNIANSENQNTDDLNNGKDSNATVVQQQVNDGGIASTGIDSSATTNILAQADTAKLAGTQSTNNVASSTKKMNKHNYQLPKWRFGVTAFYGSSNTVDGLINSNKSALSFTNVPGTGNSIRSVDHPYTASSSYQFGGVVQRKILKNGFISMGLNFVHLSTKSEVNGKIDSVYNIRNVGSFAIAYQVQSFYQPAAASTGSVSSYTNKYNFIELPVLFQQDLFPYKKLSFSYNAGFSVRQMISSDALIYNQYNNVYFSKNDLLNKTQLQFIGGLNLKLNTGKNTSIYLGPQFSYSLSNLYKTNSGSNFHFINYGLSAGLMFHKK